MANPRFFAAHTAWFMIGFSIAVLVLMMFDRHTFLWIVWVGASAMGGVWSAAMFMFGLRASKVEQLRMPMSAALAGAFAVMSIAAAALILRWVFPESIRDFTKESGYVEIILVVFLTLLSWLLGLVVGRLERRANPLLDSDARREPPRAV